MKKNKFLISLLIISLIINFTLLYINLHKDNSINEVGKVWDLATNNALFLFNQYEEMNINEAYNFASGEISTINNTISFIHYNGLNSLSDLQKGELSMFQENLVYHSDIMKQHISEIIDIIKLLQDEDMNAFTKLKELREAVEKEINP